ncbi:diffusible signal factor-reguated Ax21 faimly protein [Thermomonas flagellata]|uniref:diffusible signal factor-reguated Ax21 faimly protein n=1 Tax=Thermomonas flagellata TaxID=2888524 RepID=UPI001F03E500|nr:diffusible signal factor-reguated Ax21 faimly protein [Thermomonas flagellata]
MTTKRSMLALALLAALPFAASAADGLSYNYVQGNYAYTNTKSGDADGWGLNGSVAVHPNVFLFGSYANQDIKHTSTGYDQWRLGAGYNTAISQNTDFVADVAYDKYKGHHGGPSYDGYSVEGGVRSALLPQLEGYALLGYEDGHKISGEVYGRLGAQVKFNPNWGVAADVKLAKGGDTQWMVGPRLTW